MLEKGRKLSADLCFISNILPETSAARKPQSAAGGHLFGVPPSTLTMQLERERNSSRALLGSLPNTFIRTITPPDS